jgi:hypothetical protein
VSEISYRDWVRPKGTKNFLIGFCVVYTLFSLYNDIRTFKSSRVRLVPFDNRVVWGKYSYWGLRHNESYKLAYRSHSGESGWFINSGHQDSNGNWYFKDDEWEKIYFKHGFPYDYYPS